MNKVIVGLGEALWDCLPDGSKLGGAPANFAYHASQFGNDAYAISAIGNDALGDQTLKEFDEKHLKYVMPRVDYPTGTVQVELDEEGVPTYDIKQNVAWDNIPFTPEIENVAKHCGCVCFGSLAQRNKISRDTIHRFLDTTPMACLKIFDINLRQNFYSKEIIQDSLKACDILKINDEELVTIGRLFGYPGLDIENKCYLQVQPEDARAHLWHQRQLRLCARREELPAYTQGGSGRHGRCRRQLHRLLCLCHPCRNAYQGSPQARC